jgi:hypothetical protein
MLVTKMFRKKINSTCTVFGKKAMHKFTIIVNFWSYLEKQNANIHADVSESIP